MCIQLPRLGESLVAVCTRISSVKVSDTPGIKWYMADYNIRLDFCIVNERLDMLRERVDLGSILIDQLLNFAILRDITLLGNRSGLTPRTGCKHLLQAGSMFPLLHEQTRQRLD